MTGTQKTHFIYVELGIIMHRLKSHALPIWTALEMHSLLIDTQKIQFIFVELDIQMNRLKSYEINVSPR